MQSQKFVVRLRFNRESIICFLVKTEFRLVLGLYEICTLLIYLSQLCHHAKNQLNRVHVVIFHSFICITFTAHILVNTRLPIKCPQITKPKLDESTDRISFVLSLLKTASIPKLIK